MPFAGLVEQDRQYPAVIANLVETKVVPSSFGNERVNFQDVIRPGTKPHQSGNDEVAIRGMILVLAAGRVAFGGNPRAGIRVQALVNPGHDRSG